jgi:hypothetical protein
MKVSKKSVPYKIEFARSFSIALSNHSLLQALKSYLPELKRRTNALERAYQASLTRKIGTIARRNVCETKLMLHLNRMVSEIQGIANQNPQTAETMIHTCGLYTKNKRGRTHHTLKAVSNDKSQVTLICPSRPKSTYRWEYNNADPMREDLWFELTLVQQSKVTRKGLISGLLYYFRVAVIGWKGKENYSQVVSAMIR